MILQGTKINFEKKLPSSTKLINQHKDKLFSAISVAVYHHDHTWHYQSGCGRDSLFDLASLTKVLATTTLAAHAVEEKLFKLDTPISKYFTNFPSDSVWIGHLLNHVGGFAATLPLHEEFHEKENKGDYHPLNTPKRARVRYEELILNSWNPDQHLKQCVYSDLGFILLGWILEKTMGAPLDALFQERITRRAGTRSPYMNLQFLPISPDIVPTKPLSVWRNDHPLIGEVHDDNAYILGGIAGHAGLFGTASQCLALAREWLAAVQKSDTSPHHNLLAPMVAKEFWNHHYPSGQSRSLGWDRASTDGKSSAGDYLSTHARGHLGFTGTSLWIDPEKDLVVCMLTNRVYLSKDQMDLNYIRLFRREFHNTLCKELLTKLGTRNDEK